MAKRDRKRFRQFGCLVFLLLAGSVAVWLFASTNQIPTTSVVAQRTVCALHGPLHPNDNGVKAVWEALVEGWRSKGMPGWQFLKWLGTPKELTIALHNARPSLSGIAAINFRKGFRCLWLALRIFGKHYKGAHYIVSHRFVVGMLGGTVIAAEDEVTFCYAIDNIARAGKGEKPSLKIARKGRSQYDFIGFVNPQLFFSKEHPQLPTNLGEIGLDIVGANELQGSVFWICQSEREAEAMMRALEKVESKMAADYANKGVQCSFRKQREGMFIWWEFKLTNFTALLF